MEKCSRIVARWYAAERGGFKVKRSSLIVRGDVVSEHEEYPLKMAKGVLGRRNLLKDADVRGRGLDSWIG